MSNGGQSEEALEIHAGLPQGRHTGAVKPRSPLFKLLEASLELLVPLVMAQIIDTGIANGDRGFILSRCGILAALAAVGLVCSITAQYFAAKASVGFAAKLRSTLFKHIQSLSYSKLDTQGTGTLIARITGDINQVQSGMNLALRLLLRSPFVVFGAMIMAFTIDVKAALVFVVTIPLLSIVVFGIMLWSIPMYKKVQARLDKVLGITRENLSGVRVIRAFCKEDEERRSSTALTLPAQASAFVMVIISEASLTSSTSIWDM